MQIGARSRAVAVVSAGVLASVVGSGVAQADVNRVDSFVDGSGNTVTVTQSDTYINGVVPLDGSPLTREWFHNGRIAVAGADDFAGTVSVGYQFAYPMSIGGSINISFDTPSLTAKAKQKTETVKPEPTTTSPVEDEDEGDAGADEGDAGADAGDATVSAAEDGAPAATTKTTTTVESELVVTSPRTASQLTIAPGPGTQEVEVAAGDVSGALSELQFSNIHGTTTGVLGNLTIRPYVKVTADDGSSVVSYGDPQTLG
ncbi:MspA family porin [Rhodococcus sp. Eu-32]|uniref:MspA family porin n=1 Tax=Rhodococcus sp. Eu-32 TaxID=1017319 RepID=UPI0014037C7B|nr:MspA family porin [Rhodococcus sp. Eu-32]